MQSHAAINLFSQRVIVVVGVVHGTLTYPHSLTQPPTPSPRGDTVKISFGYECTATVVKARVTLLQ
jgi:hypothetical protein